MVELDRLVDAEVVAVDAATDEVALTDRFSETYDRLSTSAADSPADLRDRLEATVEDDAHRDALEAVLADDPAFVCTYLTVAALTDADAEACLRPAIVIDQLRRGAPPATGSPDAFLPVHGDQLGTLLRFFPRAVVYVWLDDCDPCDLVRDDLDELFEQPPDDLGLLSVYGPDHAEYLDDAFDVGGGPALLFVRNGRVYSRLYGAHFPVAIEGEVDALRNAE